MCYRQAVLDLAGIRIACLTGENGAGKSALLDAITWALWGRSRAKRDDELIHLGEDEMAVEFTFGLREQTYRVLRQRKAGKRGSTLLDFQVRDVGRWRSIAESGVRATQEKIERVLRLDHETFVNSAFLRQGRADEFTVKTPAERKRVLGEILGLDRWTVYEEQAKERLRTIQAEAGVIDLRLGEIDAELARRPEYEAELQAAQVAVAELSAAFRDAQAAYGPLTRAARKGPARVRAEALVVMLTASGPDTRMWILLEEKLSDPDAQVREVAVRALGKHLPLSLKLKPRSKRFRRLANRIRRMAVSDVDVDVRRMCRSVDVRLPG